MKQSAEHNQNKSASQSTYKLYIKNMVCPRCIMAVESILQKLDIPYIEVRLGEATLSVPTEKIDRAQLKKELEAIGFELIENQQLRYVEQIKNIVLQFIRSPEIQQSQYTFSHYLSEQTGRDYQYLSKIFSEKEGITIERYIILQKIEYVKELLIYEEFNLSEIAMKLNYSSIAHLSNQFKQITGFAPTQFKKLQDKNRRPLDNIS